MASSNGKKDYGQILSELGREMSVHTILFHNAVAERLGLNTTDHRCLDVIVRSGSVTAGQLSKATGLTTGAITGVVDRLEKAGFAQRQPDPTDRRKVLIVPVAERLQEIQKLFTSLGRSMGRVMSSYSGREAEIVVDYMRRVRDVMREENLKLRAATKK